MEASRLASAFGRFGRASNWGHTRGRVDYRLNRRRVCQRASPEARPGLGDVKQQNPPPERLVGPADKARVTTRSRPKANATQDS